MPYKDPEARKANAKAYCAAHSKEINAHRRAYYAAHREDIKARVKIDKEAKKAYDKAYYAANQEKRKAQQDAYYIAHQEELKAWARAYHVAHREEHKIRSEVYYATHQEEAKAFRKVYRENHREELIANSRSYNATHREERNAYAKSKYAANPEVFNARCKSYYKTKVVEIVCIQCGKKANANVYNSGKFCSQKCAKIWFTGPNSPHWQGGISFEPYCVLWNADLRRRIRAFFDNTCITCGKSTTENKKQLCCHHVEYNKKACCDGLPTHFAALCERCHGRTNRDRQRWESMIHRIIDEIYVGRSYFTKDEWREMQNNQCPH
jgi:hypothetical protein